MLLPSATKPTAAGRRSGSKAGRLLLGMLLLLCAHMAAAQAPALVFADFGLKSASAADQTFTASATSNSPGAITYSVVPTTATTVFINSSTGVVTIKANTTGNFAVSASQAASGSFTAASVTQGLLIGQAIPATVSINALAGVPGITGATYGNPLPTNGQRGTYTPLATPTATAVDGSGNVYFTEFKSTNAGRVYKIDAGTGAISLVAGDGSTTYTATATTAVVATATGLVQPRGLAVSSDGTVLYVSERTGRRVSKIDLVANTLILYAGNGTTTPTGTTPATVTIGPHGLALAADGTLYIADNANQMIRRINPTGTTITTVAGANGSTGSADGALGINKLNSPQGISLAANGDLYIADNLNNTIRVLSATTGDLSTVTLTGTGAALTLPNAVALDYNGNIYVAETNRVRKYSASGALITGTYTGSNAALTSNATSNNAAANNRNSSSGVVTPTGLALLNNKLYVASGGTSAVHAVTDNNFLLAQTIAFPDFGLKTAPSSGTSTFTITATSSAGLPVTFTSSNPTVASLGTPTLAGGVTSVVVTLTAGEPGNVVITASQAGNSTVQAASAQQGLLVGVAAPASIPINALAGVPGNQAATGTLPTNGNRATYTPLYNPYAVAADTVGNTYFVDYDVNSTPTANAGRVYKVNSSGVITLIAGDGTVTYTATATTAVTATATGLNQPRGIAVNRAGTVLYVAERSGRRVSKIDLTTTANNLVLYAGLASGASTPVANLASGSVTPTAFALPGPWGLALAANGSLYINENADHTVRMINPAGTAMTIVAGTSGTAGATGDGGAATSATISGPQGGLVLTRTGDLYFTDSGNNSVRKVSGGIISTFIASAASVGANGLTVPSSLARDYNGNFYVGEVNTFFRVRKYDATGTLVAGGSTFVGTGANYNAVSNPAPANGIQAANKAVTPYGLFILANKLYIASANTYSVAVVTDANLQLLNPYTFTFDDFGVKTTATTSFNATSTVPAAAGTAGQAVTYALTSYNGTTPPATVTSTGLVTISAAGNAVITATLGSNYYRSASIAQGLLIAQAVSASVPVTTIAGVPGNVQTVAGMFPVNNTRATYSPLYLPQAVNVDGYGNTYFVDYDGTFAGKVYKVTTAGVLTTVAGNGTTSYVSGGQATASGLNRPRGLAVNNAGTVLYVSEFAGNRVSHIDLTTGVITLYAGDGTTTSNGGTPTTTAVPAPFGLGLDQSDNLYIVASSTSAADVNASTILLVPAGGASMSVIAGIGGSTGSTDGALGVNKLNNPRGLVVATNGDVYIADTGNSLVRKLTAATGVVSTFITAFNAATNANGTANPNSLVLDFNGNLYVGESLRVRRYDATGTIINTMASPYAVNSTYAGNNGAFNATTNPAAANGNPSSARAITPTGLFIRRNRLYISSGNTGAVQTITDALITDPLPVELTAFTAERQGTAAVLHWNTASEKDNKGFEVQVSATGKEFKALAWVESKGNSHSPAQYRFTDEALTKLASPTVYYRLRQVDNDGTESYSPVRIVQVPTSASGLTLTLWPNPTHASVRIAGLSSGQVVQITDALGRAVTTAIAPTNGFLDLALPTGLPTGLYVVHSGGLSQRLVVE